MKSFLTTWLAEAPGVLAREFGGNPELRPSAQLPRPETATNLAVFLGPPFSAQLLVTADRYALHALLAAARLTDGTLDADRDREVWRGILQQIADAAAEAIVPAPSLSVRVEDATWTLGLPSAAYELRLGETVLLVAFTDQLQAADSGVHEPSNEPQSEAGSVAESVAEREGDAPASAFNSGDSARSSPAGIDLLLDIELEASLRFGSREMPLNELLDLGAGDVIELDRHISDPVDLLVGDKIVARGEVVLVNGSFGLRVLEVAEPRKCLESIRCLF